MRGLFPRRFQAGLIGGAFVGLLLCTQSTQTAQAQIANGNQWPNPRLSAITPMGGKVGTTIEVGFSGSELDEPQALLFSHPGIKGTPIVPPPPKPDPKAKPDPKKPPPPPPPITKFSVAIGKEVPLGIYDVRFAGKFGVSNPRVFVVGNLEEVAEKEPNNDVEQSQKVQVGTTITGVIAAATNVDYTSFTGKKSQRVLITCMCASIDSRLHPEMRLLDSSGRQLAYNRPLPGHDGLIDMTLPADGDYFLRLNQFTYTGGNNEYFYRLNFSAAPWIDAVFPPMIEPGKTAQITLYGRNLPGGKPDPASVIDGKVLEKLVVSVTASNDPLARQRLAYSGNVPPLSATLDGFEYRLQTPAGPSNPVLFTYATGPVILENDDNDTPEKPQEITVPCEVAGRIDKKRDRDWYAFTAKKGDVFTIEMYSHRLGAPTDMYLSLRNLGGKAPVEIVALDDNPETLSTKGFYQANNRDPAPYRFVVPEDGKYHILAASHLGDTLADPTHVYRLRITKEMPDFRLIVMAADEYRPDSLLLGQGGHEMLTVFASRHEGFKGDITLTVEGLPPGVTSPPQVLSAQMKFTHLVLNAADKAPAFSGEIKVTGTAIINGQKVVREARPASITWAVPFNQNIPTITRLDRQLLLAVRDKAPCKLVATTDKAQVFIGDKNNIPLKLFRTAPDFKAGLQVAPVPGELPGGIAFGNLTFAPGKDDQTAVVTIAANTPPGIYNVVFRGFAPISPNPKAKPVNTIIPSSPVQLTVLPKQVANLSVDNPNPSVKLGMDGALLVKVQRLFDYNDAFKVQLVLPAGVTGVTAADIAIPPGATEAKLTLKVPANTPPGQKQNIVVRATATVAGNVVLTHETKINVNIVK